MKRAVRRWFVAVSLLCFTGLASFYVTMINSEASKTPYQVHTRPLSKSPHKLLTSIVTSPSSLLTSRSENASNWATSNVQVNEFQSSTSAPVKKHGIHVSQPKASRDQNDSQSVSILQDMTRCSLVMGVSQEKLDLNQELLNSLAKNASLLLSSLRTVLPVNETIAEYQNPCWRTNYTIQQKFDLVHSLKGLVHKNTKQKRNVDTENLKFRDLPHKNAILRWNMPNPWHHLKQNRTKEQHPLKKWVDPKPKTSSKIELHYEKDCIKPECVHCLPYFFIAGFPKCGTTTLAAALNNHHQIAKPKVKEPQWWAKHPLKDMNDDYLKARTMVYLHNFEKASRDILDVSKPATITYDGSQSLMVNVKTIFTKPLDHTDYCALAAVVSRMLPNLKFLIVMRNPVDALYSAFYDFHESKTTWPQEMKRNASLYFHNQVKIALKNFKDCLDGGKSVFECDIECNNWGDLQTNLGGHIYVLHLKKWTQFYPIENFLFLKTKDFRSKSAEMMNEITEFLSITSVSNSTAAKWFSAHKNAREKYSQHYGDMMPNTRKLLTDFFAPYNQQLAEFLQDDRFLW